MHTKDVKPRVLLVGGGPFQLEILRAARRRAEVAVVDGSPHAPGLALADYPHVLNMTDSAAVVAVARMLGVSGVVTAASDVAVPAVSAVVQALGLPGLSPDVAARCRDKLACFEALSNAGLAAPSTHGVDDEAGARRAVTALGGYPVIVKPRSGGGGRGVTLVRAAAQLATAVACARRAYGPGEQGVLIQEFIGGSSVGVEAFFWGGTLAEAFVLDDQFEADYVSPAGHSLPPSFAPERLMQITAAVEGFGRVLGLTNGPANFDLRQVDERTVMIEINPRLGGNSITDLVRAAYGVDLAEATVCAALGQDPRPILTRSKTTPTAARLIMKHSPGPAGIVRFHEPVSHYLDYLEHPDVLALDVLVEDGKAAHVRVDDWTILGRTLVQGQDAASAVALAERVAREVSARILLE